MCVYVCVYSCRCASRQVSGGSWFLFLSVMHTVQYKAQCCGGQGTGAALLYQWYVHLLVCRRLYLMARLHAVNTSTAM